MRAEDNEEQKEGTKEKENRATEERQPKNVPSTRNLDASTSHERRVARRQDGKDERSVPRNIISYPVDVGCLDAGAAFHGEDGPCALRGTAERINLW